MAKLSSEQIDKIAASIDSGKICFYHIPSGEIVTLLRRAADSTAEKPRLLSANERKEQEKFQEIETHLNEYIPFEKMSSRNAFDAMRAFALTLDTDQAKAQLLLSLEQEHPFRRFKEALFHLPDQIKHNWQAFKNKRTRRWVEEQLELYDF